MKPEGSLPCSQQTATGPHPEPDESSPHLPILFHPKQTETQIKLALYKVIRVSVASKKWQTPPVAINFEH
jgi:hypothetical protein